MMTSRTAVVVGALACAVLGVAACSDEQLTQATEEIELCAARNRLDIATDQVEGLDTDDAAATEVEAARETVLDAVADLVVEAGDVIEARDDAGGNPIDRFNARIDAIPAGASVVDVASEIVEAAGDFLADLQDFLDFPSC